MGAAASSSAGSAFGEGIGNTGTIAAAQTGIVVSGVSTFAGGITNSSGGTISGAFGINVNNITQFGDGIANAGTIRANTNVGISV